MPRPHQRGDAEPREGAVLLRDAARHSAARRTALSLAGVASAGAGLLLPAVLGRALDLLLAGADATRWVLLCAALVLLATVLDAATTVLHGTLDARTTAWLRHRATGQVSDSTASGDEGSDAEKTAAATTASDGHDTDTT
ncbi:hypothetical protein ACWDTB_29800, partial [Streptomyces sp. NPDC003487]